MSVLSVVSILGFIAVFVIVLSNKVRAMDITVSFIELVINYVCNNLLASVPDMINSFTVNSFLIAQTACIVLVACGYGSYVNTSILGGNVDKISIISSDKKNT